MRVRRVEDDLLRAVAAGERWVAAEFHDALAPSVLRLARALLAEEEQAQEVVVDTFVHVWRCAARHDPAAESTVAWVLRAAHRCALERRRGAAAG